MKKKIKSNKVKCLSCEDIIESKNIHDFKTCKCGNVSVDGGRDYLKRSFIDLDLLVDFSEYHIYKCILCGREIHEENQLCIDCYEMEHRE